MSLYGKVVLDALAIEKIEKYELDKDTLSKGDLISGYSKFPSFENFKFVDLLKYNDFMEELSKFKRFQANLDGVVNRIRLENNEEFFELINTIDNPVVYYTYKSFENFDKFISDDCIKDLDFLLTSVNIKSINMAHVHNFIEIYNNFLIDLFRYRDYLGKYLLACNVDGIIIYSVYNFNPFDSSIVSIETYNNIDSVLGLLEYNNILDSDIIFSCFDKLEEEKEKDKLALENKKDLLRQELVNHLVSNDGFLACTNEKLRKQFARANYMSDWLDDYRVLFKAEYEFIDFIQNTWTLYKSFCKEQGLTIGTPIKL